MALWVRYAIGGDIGFGQLDGTQILAHSGDMFDGAAPTGETLATDAVKLLTPCEPRQLVALWNNFHAMAEKTDQAIPDHPSCVERLQIVAAEVNSIRVRGDRHVRGLDRFALPFDQGQSGGTLHLENGGK